MHTDKDNRRPSKWSSSGLSFDLRSSASICGGSSWSAKGVDFVRVRADPHLLASAEVRQRPGDQVVAGRTVGHLVDRDVEPVVRVHARPTQLSAAAGTAILGG